MLCATAIWNYNVSRSLKFSIHSVCIIGTDTASIRGKIMAYLSKHTGTQIDSSVDSVINGATAEAVATVNANYLYSLDMDRTESTAKSLFLRVKGLTNASPINNLKVFLMRYGRRNNRGPKSPESFGWRHPKNGMIHGVAMHQVIPSAYKTEFPIEGELVNIGNVMVILRPFLHFSSKVMDGELSDVEFRILGKRNKITGHAQNTFSGKTNNLGFAVYHVDGASYTRVSDIFVVSFAYEVNFRVSETVDNVVESVNDFNVNIG